MYDDEKASIVENLITSEYSKHLAHLNTIDLQEVIYHDVPHIAFLPSLTKTHTTHSVPFR